MFFFFFFKQKTAYEMRISDWSSDVCSSDLLALIEEARARADHVVTSIFVNPIQFGANEDLDRYPRREASDAKLLSDRGCDVLWAPPVEEVYPPGFATNVSVGGVSEGLCGGSRPDRKSTRLNSSH